MKPFTLQGESVSPFVLPHFRGDKMRLCVSAPQFTMRAAVETHRKVDPASHPYLRCPQVPQSHRGNAGTTWTIDSPRSRPLWTSSLQTSARACTSPSCRSSHGGADRAWWTLPRSGSDNLRESDVEMAARERPAAGRFAAGAGASAPGCAGPDHV